MLWGSMEIPKELLELFSEFAAGGVRYLLVGGHAVGAHNTPFWSAPFGKRSGLAASVRANSDVDTCLERVSWGPSRYSNAKDQGGSACHSSLTK
jgi:hypothetical protein